MQMHGHARDLHTPQSGDTGQVVAESRIDALLSPRREVLSISSSPLVTGVEKLVGARGGGHLRAAIANALPQERAAGTPLHLLLDDLAGASLVAGWAWTRWIDNLDEMIRNSEAKSVAGRNGHMEGVCTGFSPGSSALRADGTAIPTHSCAPVPPLPNPEDPQGWHELTKQTGVGMRRARRLDVWLDDVVRIDVGFQDSATAPQGGRVAIHEYHVTATADPHSLALLSINADPRVLPYRECPGAVQNVARLLGQPLVAFRTAVLESLPGALGCTHLNDVLRSLADVPQLLRAVSMRESSG